MKLEFSEFLDQRVLPKLNHQGAVEVVLLTCMDFRYPHRIIETMDAKGLRGKYDHLVLAGASLGVNHDPEWQDTFLDHLIFAVAEHQASQVIILDHRDCGAYKKFLGVTATDPAVELAAHQSQCQQAMTWIVQQIPVLAGRVQALLLPIETIDDLGSM